MSRGARALARAFRGKPGTPGAAARALTALSLELAVPEAIGCLQAEPDCARALAAMWERMITDYGEALAVLAARDQPAFDRLARGIAALALRPGGVTYCGRLWEADSTGTV